MYMIICSEVDGDFTYTHSIYKRQELAEFECDILNQLQDSEYPCHTYRVEEIELSDDKVNLNDKVGNFYMYAVNKDNSDNSDNYNDVEKVLKRYNDSTSFVEDDKYAVTAYDLYDYNNAKTTAIKYYTDNYK